MLGNCTRALRPLLLLLLLVSLSVSCGPKPPPDEPAQPTISPQTPTPPPSPDVEDIQEEPWKEPAQPVVERVSSLADDAERFNADGVLATVHFETDKSELRPEARQVLTRNASWLRNHPGLALTIEGHCDERNTEEYNLALGERRADSVRTYLVSLGIQGDRLETISYGEERPTDPRQNEAAWAKNRRADFVLKPM